MKKITTILLLLVIAFPLVGCQSFIGGPADNQALEEDLARTKQQLEEKYKPQNQTVATQEKPVDATSSAPETDTDIHLSVARPEGEPVEIINIDSLKAVSNGGTSPTVTLNQSYFLTYILTYHWNGSKGTPAGTISLRDSSGKVYGPWQAKLESGVYWTADPETAVPAGTYTVIDSDPGTWSQNSETGGRGITHAKGIPVK